LDELERCLNLLLYVLIGEMLYVQLSRTQVNLWRPPMVAYCRLGHSLPEESASRKTQDNYSPLLQIPSDLPSGISARQIELRLQELSR